MELNEKNSSIYPPLPSEMMAFVVLNVSQHVLMQTPTRKGIKDTGYETDHEAPIWQCQGPKTTRGHMDKDKKELTDPIRRSHNGTCQKLLMIKLS